MSTVEPDDFTIPNVHGDFYDWHLGRPLYALWALELEDQAVQALVCTAQRHLNDLLLDDYVRQPHVTLGLCGFPTLHPQRPDDYGPEHFQAQCQALRQAALSPFTLSIGALDTFHTVPYLQVHDPESRLAALRQAVATGPLDREHGQPTPHVTVGLYHGRWPLALVRQRLQALALSPVTVQVTGVSLLAYRANEIGGTLQTLARFDLSSQLVQSDKLPQVWLSRD